MKTYRSPQVKVVLAVLAAVLAMLAMLAGCATSKLGTEGNPIVMSFVAPGGTGERPAAGEQLAGLISDETGLIVRAEPGTDPAAVRQALCAGKASIGWLTSSHYLLAHEECGANLAMATVRLGTAAYRGQIIVRADSGIGTIADLKGKVMCWVDPASASATGLTIPRIVLKASGLDPGKDLAKTIEVGSDELVVTAVYNGDCDAGMTSGDTRGDVEPDLPDVKDKVTILAATIDIPNDGAAFAEEFPADVRDEIVAALLDIAGTDEGRSALKAMLSIDGLQQAGDSFYDPFRDALSKAGIQIEALAR